jgi:tetratricopeptide (TPR) repeat protein
MTNRASLLVVLAVAGAVPSVAAAAVDHRPGRALFEQAETKFNLGKFEDAAADYQSAYEAEPLPAFLFNIGQCYRNMGNYERAQFFFRRYVTLDPLSPNRPVAERLIAEMDRLAEGRVTRPRPPAARAPDADPLMPVLQQSGDMTPASPPVYRRAWFWLAAAAVVVGGIAAGVAIAADDRQPSLTPIDAR